MYRKFGKRAFDFFTACIGLIVLSPLCVAITILLVLIDRQVPFFFQKRPGLKNKVFVLVKFKTMRPERGGDHNRLPDGKRITPFGKFLRKTSLDELPQLWNVLIGDMSIIGPRPLLVEYLPLYNRAQQKRHNVRPGISGWAQVHGRNSLQWENKFVLDIWYTENVSLLLDLKIIGLTIKRLFSLKHISSIEIADVEKFTG